MLSLLLFVITISGIAQSIRLNYGGDSKDLIKAVEKVNQIVASPEFYQQIESHRQFENSNYSGTDIANEIKALNKVIEITVSTTATTIYTKSTDKVLLNKDVLTASFVAQINTILQELVDVVDWQTNANWDYSPNTTNTIDRVRTAACVVGKIGENMVSETLSKTQLK